MRSKLQEVERELFVACADDYVGLWVFFWEARHEFNSAEPKVIRLLALAMLYDLLDADLIQAGDLSADGRDFIPWQHETDATMHRIMEALDALAEEPTLGDIAWFTTTKKGDEVAKEDALAD